MERAIGKSSSKLLDSVKQRSTSKKAAAREEGGKGEEKKQVAYLDKDCISSILMKLPLESIPSSRFVCRAWYDIITSLPFIDGRLARSESVLIYLNPGGSTSTTMMIRSKKKFSVEGRLLRSQPLNMFATQQSAKRSSPLSIGFVECKAGKGVTGDYGIECLGDIRAACDGFVLIDNGLKRGGVLIMNPVTRQLLELPVGTLSRPNRESYGIALSRSGYKVVHLFVDDMKYVACETLDVVGTSRSWKPVNGPPSGTLRHFGLNPVSATGALHWLPWPSSPSTGHIVSMDLETETFHVVPLPKVCGTHDRILEMGGLLGFVSHEVLDIDVWKLRGSVVGGDVVWTKHHKIMRGCLIDMVPLFCLRIKGDLIFKRAEGGSVYSYDFETETMTVVEMDERFRSHGGLLPHVNSLGSWTTAA